MAELPAELTSFVGRDRDIAEVQRLLGEARLVTLTGVGGVGKTRLALRVAARTTDACLVELSGVDSPDIVAHTVAAALNVGDQSGRAPLDVVADFLRDRTLLLVLDTCEHLPEACAELTSTLLRAAPSLTVMATSRRSLGVPGEHVWRVSPLPEHDQTTLFAHRATAVAPGFTVTPDVAPLCRKLDGIPLAIELAAVWLRTLTLPELVARLDDGLDLPGTQAAVQWSYDLCSPEEQTLWAQLSVFAGFDLHAAEAVCDGDVLPVLDRLVDKSVVLNENGRYRLLDTLREFGRRQLLEPVATRHRDHFLALAERLDAEWFGPDQLTWQGLMRTEHDNLRAAMEFCLATPGEIRAGMRMAAALWFHWHCGGLMREGRYWLDRFAKADLKPSRERGRLLAEAGRIASYQGDLDDGLAMIHESLELAAEFDDAAGLARATEHLAVVLQISADVAAAELFAEAVTRYEALAFPDAMEPLARLQLAMTAAFSGDPRRGAELCDECMLLCEKHNELWARSFAHQGMAHAAWRLEQRDEAEQHTREALRIKSRFGDMLGTALALELLGWVGAGERAAVLLGAARNVWHSFGLPTFGTPLFGDAHDDCEARLRAELGHRFDPAFQRGQEMTPDQAVAYAIRPKRTTALLTHREQQIAELIGEGMTNKRIAAELVISQRTVESHVEQIRHKLGFANRAQIAAWTARGKS